MFRGIEMRLDMVRVSTAGISAIIDAAGRVTVPTRPVDPGALPGVTPFGLTGTVALLDGPDSFYARHGPVFAWLNLLVTLALLVVPSVMRWKTREVKSPAQPRTPSRNPGQRRPARVDRADR